MEHAGKMDNSTVLEQGSGREESGRRGKRDKMTQITSFSDAINSIVNAGWGRKQTIENLAKSFVENPSELAAWCLVELLQRLDRLFPKPPDPKTDRHIIPNASTKKFPAAKVGDLLWGGSLEEGFDSYVVIAKDDDGHCLVVKTKLRYYESFMAPTWLFLSLEEAIRDSIESDERYHQPRVKRLAEIKQALDSGASPDTFVAGYDLDE